MPVLIASQSPRNYNPVFSVQECATSWEIKRLSKSLERATRREEAVAEEYLLWAKRAQEEKEEQEREARAAPSGSPKHLPVPQPQFSNFAAQADLLKSNSAVGALNDDYYSPITPEEYIELRLMPAIEFYQNRVPTNTHLRLLFKLLLLSATVASSFLARYQMTHFVTIATAFSSMIVSYAEFADADRKVER